jgi:glycosyltransferase involved in cell wall biosynthesis
MKKNYTICLVGSKERVIYFANYLAVNNFNVHLITGGGTNYKKSKAIKLDSRVIYHSDFLGRIKPSSKIHYFAYPFLFLKFKKRIKTINPDIIHAFFVPGNGWLAALSNFHPYVITTMGSDINSDQGAFSNLLRRILTPYTIRKADGVTVVTKQGYDVVQSLSNTKNLIYFRNGFNPKLFFQDKKNEIIKKKLNLEDEFVVLSPRGFNKSLYNIETIIRGFHIFNTKKKDSKLLLLGNTRTAYAGVISQIVKELSLEDQVIFCGQVMHNTMKDYYGLSDVVVSILPSDGFPSTVVEAQACGVPLVVGNNKSIDDIFTNERNGFIIDPFDYHALASKLLALYNNRGMCEKIAMNNTEDAIKHEQSKYFEHIVQLYKEVI